MGELLRTESFRTKQRHAERKQRVKENESRIPERYEGDIRRYLEFCGETYQEDGVEAMLDYLHVSLNEHRVKKNTWERRLAAVKKHLAVTQGIDFKTMPEVSKGIKSMRMDYKEEENAKLVQLTGKSPVMKDELLNTIHGLTDVRAKAVCLVNLVTANRPSEMVRLKIEDFDLDGRFVRVYLKKQRTWHNKRLTLDAVKAVKAYIRKYNLKGNDYFVGRVNKHGTYESAEMTEVGYSKALQRWTGLTGYNFRKTQVVSMHEAGADLATIARQTGHKSLETIAKHYLTVSDSTVDKYL